MNSRRHFSRLMKSPEFASESNMIARRAVQETNTGARLRPGHGRLEQVSGSVMLESVIETKETRLAPRSLMFARKLVTMLAAGLGTVSCGHLRAQPTGTAATRTAINMPVQNGFNDGTTPAAPNGRQDVFSAISDKKVQLWLPPLDSPTAHALEGTENG
jgi:hypothetical protein